ncbi:glypican-1-like isoform X1 [Scleropages formosus]|uniref:Glypican-1 n=1 Tax=Scleropages formosus TaxID=113540 RepID=A0A8C9TCY2_SCLFO|nr:glypican-1-like isoform X1 [Scleropages formosus]
MALCLALLLCALAPRALGENTGGSRARSCADVRQFYGSKGFGTSAVPHSELSGEHLRVCPQGYTCCTSEMEEQLSNMSRQEVEKLVREAGRSLQTSLQNQYRSFDGYFLELLNRSEYSLLHSLRSTEGQHYAQNAHVFRDLYSDLRDHYRGNGVNLEEALNDLWARLLEQFLRASDPQRDMGDDFLECASKQADLLRPFGDAPRDLKLKAIRTFVVARSFRQGLLVSAEVVRKVSQVPLSPECNNAIMRLTYCPQCRGLVDIKPCTSYCRNVMKGCLANQADLDTEWGNLVDAMLQVAERFKGASGVEMFVLALSAHLSDAVLSMQENAEVFSSKVLQACGSPGETNVGSSLSEEIRAQGKVHVEDQATAGGRLEKLVMDTCRKLKDMQQYWTQLPNALCKVTAGAANEENCWNGVAQARYLPQVMGDGLANQINNPEVEIDITKPDMTVRQQIMQLKITTNRLKNAFDGNDVDFLDTSDDISGSGSGMCHGDLCHHDPRLSIPRTDQPNIFAYPAEKKGVRGSGNKTILCSVLLVLSLITVLLQR